MKKVLFVVALAVSVFAVAAFMPVLKPAPVSAQVGRGLSGPHYNLNIIGVPRGINPDMDNTNGHTIFVPLEGTVKIYYVAGDEFRVIDRNGTDADGATVEVPHSDLDASVCYDVYAWALGKPYGNAVVQADCIIEDLIGDCRDALLLDSFEVERKPGKPKRENISDIFRASGCIDVNASGTCDSGDLQFNNVWIFNIPQLVEYFWDYTNNNLRIMQVRFYKNEGCGSFTTVP